MTIYQDFAALRGKLFDTFEVPTATITSTVTGTRSSADRAAGKVSAPIVTTRTVRASLAPRRVQIEDGTWQTRIVATLDGPIAINDVLTVGARSYTVDDVAEINPDGQTSIVWKATMR